MNNRLLTELWFKTEPKKNFLIFLSLITMTNLSFLCLNFYLNTQRPYINTDYLYLLVFFIFNKKSLHIIGFILYTLCFCLDVFIWSRQFFPFMRLSDAFYLLKFVFIGPVVFKIAFIIFIIILIIQVIFFIKLTKKSNWMTFFFILCMIQLLSILDIKTDRNQYISKFSNTGFIESQTYYAYRLKDDLINAMTTWKPKIITAKYTGATEFLFDRIDAQSPLSNQILLVTVESWGRTLDHNVEIDLLQGFLQNTNQFEYFNQGELPFIGATVNAELRELCRLDTMNFNLRAAEPLKFKNCLGNRLQELGYQTYGIHGANGLMYDRSSWYPKAGLAHTTFFENLKNPTRCYSFPGACDSDLIPVVYDAFRDKKKKTFLHWMSITSHYPYDLRDLKSDHFDCTRFDIPNHTEGCRNLKLQKQFLNDLAIMIHNPALKGVEVIVVGDHMPPLIMDHGSTVFKPNIVPWLHFKIKE